MMGLTRAQAELLDAIRRLTVGAVAPSYNELCAEVGLASRGALQGRLAALRDRGFIEFEFQRARSIRILGDMEGLERRSDPDLRKLRARIDEILRGRGQ